MTISHPMAAKFPGHRRVLVRLSSPDPVAPAYHPVGTWRLEVEAIRFGGTADVTVRLSADGHTPYLLLAAAPTHDQEQGTLRLPTTSREVLSVANCVPALAPLSLAVSESGPGPVRRATLLRPAGFDRRWLPYAKPEITAPGTVAAPCSALTEIWAGERPRQWNTFGLPDGRFLMTPGWHGLDRSGQRLARGVHSEEGEVPALFDNLVRIDAAGYAPAANAASRGASPPKR